MSTQKSRSGVYKASKYFHKDEGCVLFESNIYTPMNSSKRQIANAIATSIENDVAVRTKGRKQSVRSQHDMVSFHTNDNVTPEQAKQIVKELYEQTHNLSNRKYALGVHIDTDEVHVHIVWALKDFNGKCYNVSNDYRVIERECEKLEQKYNLIVPENRISRDMDELDKIKELTLQDKKDIINKKYKDKHPSTKERMLDVRGVISNKKQMKDALSDFLNNASSPSDFINQITENGFNVIHNGKSSFSIQHEDQIFKASELGLSYKTLKAKLGDDTGFEQTLKNKHNVKEYENCSIASTEAEPDYMKKIKPNSVLATKFKFIQHSDKVEYFYNSASSKKSFEYYKDPSKVSFHDLSRQSAKAGIQRLVADAKPPQSFTVNGPDYFKKNVWLEFQLMGLEAKGFKLEGYKPTPADLDELKKIQEQYASMNKKADPKPQPAPEAPTVAVEAPKPVEPVMPIPLQKAPEKPPEPTKQVEQEQVAPTNDDLIDDLMKEFEPSNPTPVAEAPTKALETPTPVEPAVDDIYAPMTPEPIPEPENHKIDGDYSTYSNDEIVEEFEWLQPRLTKSLFPGNSTRDIAGHREMDNIPDNRNGIKTGEVKRQYELRQKLYNLFDEIKERDPSAAKQLEQAFKAQMANKRAVTFDLKPQLTK
ncbi:MULTISPECIES: relaxase/mobilization nuclease domain-containing protein [Pseudomonas]|uniref:Relaxase/mobilization nuclease domain-containing protein n=5 Tax=Pseudomonas TaxID=286 RepID=A0ABR6T8F1_9PSED|nr:MULTISPECIES: relaxase/mobilization nuclease domain-containing protein [Pseudomonas]EKT4463181.1 relaxase/mobilization nuclease domain-containing protein [Pseudomonas putida]MEB0053282.1 relaxase/mobilization nuclease domain-containing protein [Pseudomonas sp. FG1]MBC2382223.1 relaxase/mobilization nuclease domain-containing protein [Pseudomonas cremoris]MBJ2241804.1 relaxase/mobilization nuclease domain-containing protein [Pseudomonas sp. MF6768]MBJ2290981.1 relaxase/mobilization nuclease 